MDVMGIVLIFHSKDINKIDLATIMEHCDHAGMYYLTHHICVHLDAGFKRDMWGGYRAITGTPDGKPVEGSNNGLKLGCACSSFLVGIFVSGNCIHWETTTKWGCGGRRSVKNDKVDEFVNVEFDEGRRLS
eukprot:15365354-Ditylum_brightwellii.AAC.3